MRERSGGSTWPPGTEPTHKAHDGEISSTNMNNPARVRQRLRAEPSPLGIDGKMKVRTESTANRGRWQRLKVKWDTGIRGHQRHGRPQGLSNTTNWMPPLVQERRFAQRWTGQWLHLQRAGKAKTRETGQGQCHQDQWGETGGLHSKVKGCSRRGGEDGDDALLGSSLHNLGTQNTRGSTAWGLKGMVSKVRSHASLLMCCVTFSQALNFSVVWCPHPHKWRQ